MKLFEIQPSEDPEGKTLVWHLDLDHVVYLKHGRLDDGRIYWWVEKSGGGGFFVTKPCFDRIMQAWESK